MSAERVGCGFRVQRTRDPYVSRKIIHLLIDAVVGKVCGWFVLRGGGSIVGALMMLFYDWWPSGKSKTCLILLCFVRYSK